MNIRYNKFPLYFFIIITIFFLGWSLNGHFIINQNAKYFINPSILSVYTNLVEFMKNHASDADVRKSADPNESAKHYIDIDNYPEYIESGYINQSLEYNISYHGYRWIENNGFLPWAIISAYDSLQAAFKRFDKTKIEILCADLGHYIGDMHNPFHLTKNYDGQLTGQKGIHGRYEFNLIYKYNEEISFSGFPSFYYIQDISDYVFQRIYRNVKKVDTILRYDSIAYVKSGNKYNDAYYQELWNRSKDMAIDLLKESSIMLAEVINTAYQKAGFQTNNVKYSLEQNFPNPFNLKTAIYYTVIKESKVSIKVFNVLGEHVTTLAEGVHLPGFYHVDFYAKTCPSGVYYYIMKTEDYEEIKRRILIK